MGMFLSYGTHQHAIGECSISIDRTVIENEAKAPIAVLETWNIQGMLTSLLGPTDLDQQISALMAAYEVHAQDLILFLPDGVTPSSSQLLSANTLGGTRVTKAPSFPTGEHAERVTFAHYTCQVQGELPLDTANMLVDFHETLKFRGGLPAIGFLEPAVGLPEQQLWKQYTTYKVTQEGHATGYLWQPAIGIDVGLPIWPAALLPDKSEYDYDSPDAQGISANRAYKNYKVSWHYEFESITPLVGNPTRWPATL
jgi:hypothetical protein